ncbi:hypothetical protein M9Y10_031408 [Tritrichomonas musculus]|uniref:Protein kinase domain-containing protein n=1 Tax=Tritrichomonas musculus TaxID=1915356 RepID=A0ABR2H0K5_9EUKA
MIEDILRFYKTISRHQIELDTVFKEIVQDYSIFHISESSFPNDDEKQKITDKIKESQVVIIDQNQELNKKMQNKCFIIGFEKTLIIFEYSSKSESFLREFFSIHSQILTCDLSDQNNKMQIFRDEINEFKRFVYNRIYSQQAWKITSSCILGYLIKKSYLKLNQNRIEKFNSERDDQKEPEIFEKEEFVELRTVGNGSFALCKLVYHIKRQELFVVKKPNTNDVENDKLLKREIENYKKIKHPFLPKFYGTVKDKNYLVIEFINGSTLKKMSPDYLNFNEKITVIFELIFAMKYMHDNKFIYRDLKPNNVMIDENKTAVLIDFDRLISNENNEEIQEQTLDINADFLAPEVNVNRKFTYKSDIYSLGKIIKYIIGQKEDVASGSLFKSIIEKCTKENPEERPSISDLIDPKLFLEESQFSMSLTHILFDNLSLAANQNDPHAQFYLDISKSIHYLTLAADQNDPPAQFDLGVIYYEGRFVTRDINKSIHYLTLAANQYHPDAQFSLGLIYYSGRYVTRDINKSIQYLSLAANQNDPPAQSYLGLIYYSGRYVTRDINKSIQYLSLAANQNDPQAQFSLGLIYYEYQNIKQAQYYLIKASINQFRPAHFSHGFLLHSRKGATKDIHDAIRYYKEASSFNNQYAKNNLGIIYKNGFGDEVKARTGSAIEYFEEAIRQKRDYLSMYNLAHIYIYSDFIEHDIDKSINLLIRSSNKFHHSLILLSIILMKKYGNISNTIHEIKKLTDDIVIQSKVYITIMNINSGNGEILNYLYEFYRSRDFLYDIFYNPILSSNLQNKIYHENVERPYAKNISDLFYQGFGCDLIIE